MRTNDRGTSLKHLLELTVGTDDPRQVIEAAGAVLRRELALVDTAGAELGRAPHDGGDRAVAVARSAARTSVIAPPGWEIVPIRRNGAPLAILVVGTAGPDDPETRQTLDLLPALLAGQLGRSALVGLQRAAFLRRLVSGPPVTAHSARREAAELGMVLDDAYWVAIAGSPSRALAPGVVERLEHDIRGRAEGGLAVARTGELVLLHPGRSEQRGDAPARWFREAAERARELAPSVHPQVIAVEHTVDLAGLSGQVALLEVLQRFPPRGGGDVAVAWTRDFALDRLLHFAVAPEQAAGFVDLELGRLIDWDRQNRGDLLHVLEAALDFPRHDEAARRCFMHRNTFRHRLRVATEVLGVNLDSPDARLAVHVALKLRRLNTPATEDAAGPAPAAPAGARPPRARGQRARARDVHR